MQKRKKNNLANIVKIHMFLLEINLFDNGFYVLGWLILAGKTPIPEFAKIITDNVTIQIRLGIFAQYSHL